MCTLEVKVIPSARKDRIVGMLGTALKVQVRAAPERGRANLAVIELLAESLQIPPTHITLIRGAASPRKTLQIEGVSSDELSRRVAAVIARGD